MNEDLKKKRDVLAANMGQTKGYEPSAFRSGFNTCFELMSDREKGLVEALEFECGNRCSDLNPCNAKEALAKIK